MAVQHISLESPTFALSAILSKQYVKPRLDFEHNAVISFCPSHQLVLLGLLYLVQLRRRPLSSTSFYISTPEMRLLDVYNFEIQSGFPDQIFTDAKSQLWHRTPSAATQTPRYAILSHRWIGEEVTFQDFQMVPKSQLRVLSARKPVPLVSNGSPTETQSRRSSIFKIAGACNKVRQTNDKAAPQIRHIWIDTICINKGDAQELSTSINSMFRWYQSAEVCYVYLFDVSWNGTEDPTSQRQFVDSEWFRRGWTLQELLAPRDVQFFDRDWKYIGAKDDLIASIVEASHIAPEHLLGSFHSASLAQKMSWLARRETKFVEDRAYCVLGIFGIYLDARYGQGEDEFLRLQVEIIKSWKKKVPFDESLFAWTSELVESSGLLAPAPRCFEDAGDIIFDPKKAKDRGIGLVEGIEIDTAREMRFTIPLIFYVPLLPVVNVLTLGALALYYLPTKIYGLQRQHCKVKLNCWSKTSDGRMHAKRLKMERAPNHTWRRVDCGRLYHAAWPKLYPSRMMVYLEIRRIRISPDIKYKA